MDGNILCFPVHHPAFLKLTAVIDCFKDYCLTLTQKTLCSYRALEEKQSLPPFIGTHVLGLCFLEESLMHSRSHRLVSRRNIVPIL